MGPGNVDCTRLLGVAYAVMVEDHGEESLDKSIQTLLSGVWFTEAIAQGKWGSHLLAALGFLPCLPLPCSAWQGPDP